MMLAAIWMRISCLVQRSGSRLIPTTLPDHEVGSPASGDVQDSISRTWTTTRSRWWKINARVKPQWRVNAVRYWPTKICSPSLSNVSLDRTRTILGDWLLYSSESIASPRSSALTSTWIVYSCFGAVYRSHFSMSLDWLTEWQQNMKTWGHATWRRVCVLQ